MIVSPMGPGIILSRFLELLFLVSSFKQVVQQHQQQNKHQKTKSRS
jgi:hypothetical protein